MDVPEIKEKLSDLDVLINNAGIGVFKELTDMDRASFDGVFRHQRDGRNVHGA